MNQEKKFQLTPTKITIAELNRRINIKNESNHLSENGIEILKDTITIIEGRIRISKN